MTDDELINNMAENLEKVLNAALDSNGLHAVQNASIKDKFYRLIALARIGAAVKPWDELSHEKQQAIGQVFFDNPKKGTNRPSYEDIRDILLSALPTPEQKP